IGDITLTKPDDVVANTLDRFAFASKRTDASNGRLYETDWRLLDAGRLRAVASVADTMAVLNLTKDQYISITYSGNSLEYMTQSTAKLNIEDGKIVSGQAYKIESDGALLLKVPAGDRSCDITIIEVTGTERVSEPYFTEREKVNEVVVRLGASNLGNKVYVYYTTDGSTPDPTNSNSEKIDKNTTVTVDESCTLKAICVSETGVKSNIAEYVFDLSQAGTSSSVVYDLEALVTKGDTLTFGSKGISVSYMENNNGWEEKSRGDFYPATNLDEKVSVRAGNSSITYDAEAGTLLMKRAFAIHDLGVGDEIIILYKGNGSVINVTGETGDEFTVNGKTLGVADEIGSGEVIKITKTKFANNYVVFNVSGEVFITAIYINKKAPDMVIRPKIALLSVDLKNETATYRISFESGTELHYILSKEEVEMTGSKTGTYDLTIERSDKITMWATRGSLKSEELTTSIFAPTPEPSEDGEFDFTETSADLPSDLEVTLDEGSKIEVEGEALLKPSAMTSKTFDGKFAFTQTNTQNKVIIRTNRHLVLNRGTDMHIGLLNLKKGDIISFDYSGTLRFNMPSKVKLEQVAGTRSSTRSSDNSLLVSGEAYIVQQNCDILLNAELTETAVSIAKMYIGPAPSASEPAAIDFVSAFEGEEELDIENAASVWYYEKTSGVTFRRLANWSDALPIDGKISTEGGYGTLDNSGFMNSRRNIAIHNLAQGDTIKVRFSGGDIVYYGHETKGDIISVNGRILEPGDTLHTGDVIKVEKVDYLNNYVVLRFDAKVAISGIFINQDEVERVLMPTITDKGNNTFLITAGVSTTGKQVTTCYTTDGTEPTRMNGISGPYDSFEVQLLRGNNLVIKAVSYTDDGQMSRVATLDFFAYDMTAIEGITTDKEGTRAIFDVHGRRITTMAPGHVYIINGKKVFFNRY
ncbi:MAG: chitobiase/beta-hexosaminidase C-terminal domain-containing protein, partial [Prevotella sp.]|nr:chitobiase/beta-hexosaminidase C-terminal domain-containing protein [Prevotella sp.]